MPAPDPLTRLVALAGEVARFADEIERRTDLDSRAFRAWQAELTAIAAELQRHGVAAPVGGGERG